MIEILKVKSLKKPVFPEIFMLEINHACETLWEIIEDSTANDIWVLIENRDTEIWPL